MSFLDSIKIAFASIFAHKMRSVLTMIGIMIGIGSIITVVAIGQGGEAMLKSKFAGSGNNTVAITFAEDVHDPFIMNTEERPELTEEDIFEIKKIPEVSEIVITNTKMETLDIHDHKEPANITGVDSAYFLANKIYMREGRTLNEKDMNQGNNAVMINTETKKLFFPKESPIGKIIEIRGQPLEVIGVYESDDHFMSLGNAEALIPISLWPTLYGKNEIQNISVQAKHVDQLEKAGEKAIDVLNARKPSDTPGKYEMINLNELQNSISTLTNIMTMIIGGIAGISLFVGGIGVMNIMLVSITERTREIGIRKALGATRGKILLQFLIEAVMLTLLGGIIGICLGYTSAYIFSLLAKWPPLVSWEVVLGGVLFSMTLGIIFGLIPANKAAKLSPIEALRYE